MIDEKQRFSISPLTDRERVTLGMRMDDLLKFLGLGLRYRNGRFDRVSNKIFTETLE